MKFNFQRVRTPAYLTSMALVLVGLLFAVGSVPVAAWIFVLLGIALNVVAVSVTEITASRAHEFRPTSRVVVEPDADTEAQPTVAAGRTTPAGRLSRGGSTGRAGNRTGDDAAAGASALTAPAERAGSRTSSARERTASAGSGREVPDAKPAKKSGSSSVRAAVSYKLGLTDRKPGEDPETAER